MVRNRHIYRSIDIVHPRAVPVILGLCHTAGIAEIVDRMVVQSSSLDERKEETLKRRIKAQKEELEKEARELAAGGFACEPDARSALEELMAKAAAIGYHVDGDLKPDRSADRRRRALFSGNPAAPSHQHGGVGRL